MPLKLVRLDSHPHEIAATKSARVTADGAFFLDFTRPLQRRRLIGVGPTTGLLVPVVHQAEQVGGHAFSLRRGAPYFDDIQTLWQQRYPSQALQPESIADPLKVVADFAAQFPEDSHKVHRGA